MPLNLPPQNQSTPPPPQKPFRQRRGLAKWLHWLHDYQIPVILLGGVCSAILIFTVMALFWSPPDLTFDIPGTDETFTIHTPKPVVLTSDMILLVMGVDANYGGDPDDPFSGARTDTMMLVRISPENHTVSAVSIPRDSKVFLGRGRQVDKINAAFAYGGADLAVRTVERTFGVPVDGFLAINNKGVRAVVDALGGVSLTVEKRMKYRDNTAKLNIDLQPGRQKLDGEAAEGYLRFRHDELGDIGRVRRQQNFINAVASELKNPLNIARIPQLVGVAQKYIQTDLGFNQLLGLAWFGKGLDMRRVRVATVPGHGTMQGLSYWIIHPRSTEKVLNRLLLDNQGLRLENSSENHAEQPLSVGLLMTNTTDDDTRQQWADRIEAAGFTVICQSTRKETGNQLIEHTSRVNDADTLKLQRVLSQWKNPRVIFAPVGSTFEQNSCNGREDYTVMVGHL